MGKREVLDRLFASSRPVVFAVLFDHQALSHYDSVVRVAVATPVATTLLLGEFE
jgi:hypothetical protein